LPLGFYLAVLTLRIDGHGVNLIVDFIGPDYWDKNVEALAKDGRMVVLASMSGSRIPTLYRSRLLY
jgi:NADPH:quinone reductase-like Zn-dependent oxidoreductase